MGFSPKTVRAGNLALALVLVLALGATACGEKPAQPTPVDTRYPSLGDSGYMSKHYVLDLSIDVAHNTLDGTVTLTARADQQLKQFDLDLLGFDVRSATVDGQPARFAHQGNKLTLIPAHALRRGADFTVAIDYRGTPTTVTTPGSDGGWHNLGQEVYVTSEPDGAEGWFPVNDVPRDKASYTFRLTVADPDTAVANGVLAQTIPHPAQGTTTYVWQEAAPMASYLATLAVGRFSRLRQTGPNGLPIVIYAPPGLESQVPAVFAAQPEMIAYFQSLLGPFPFAVYGAIITGADVRWALETQTRPVFSRSILTLEPDTAQEGIAHELAHQWFGDSVSLEDWQDIWLNEGFATYLSWLWLEHAGDRDFLTGLMRSQYGYILNAPQYAALLNQPQMPPQQVLAIVRQLFQPDGHPVPEADILQAMGLSSLDQLTSARALGLLAVHPGSADAWGYLELAASSAPANPPPNDLFATSVYARGAMTLQALRIQVGDATFFRILRDYATRYRFGNARTADFIKVAESDSGRDLTTFFQTWLDNPNPPPMPKLLASQ